MTLRAKDICGCDQSQRYEEAIRAALAEIFSSDARIQKAMTILLDALYEGERAEQELRKNERNKGR
jgi:hypothetical protein